MIFEELDRVIWIDILYCQTLSQLVISLSGSVNFVADWGVFEGSSVVAQFAFEWSLKVYVTSWSDFTLMKIQSSLLFTHPKVILKFRNPILIMLLNDLFYNFFLLVFDSLVEREVFMSQFFHVNTG